MFVAPDASVVASENTGLFNGGGGSTRTRAVSVWLRIKSTILFLARSHKTSSVKLSGAARLAARSLALSRALLSSEVAGVSFGWLPGVFCHV